MKFPATELANQLIDFIIPGVMRFRAASSLKYHDPIISRVKAFKIEMLKGIIIWIAENTILNHTIHHSFSFYVVCNLSVIASQKMKLCLGMSAPALFAKCQAMNTDTSF